MPFYRFPTGMVHVRGTNLPKPCLAHIVIEDKDVINASPQLARCLAMSRFLCDWPITTARGKPGTCDPPLCDAHSGQVGPNKNYCPEHLQESQQGQRGLFTSLAPS